MKATFATCYKNRLVVKPEILPNQFVVKNGGRLEYTDREQLVVFYKDHRNVLWDIIDKGYITENEVENG